MARTPRQAKRQNLAPKQQETLTLATEQKDWQDATCPVCLERPHNAVLLLCSSHNRGCRPYMCRTGVRMSNCLSQFQKAYSRAEAKVKASSPFSSNKDPSGEAMELACPLCRGQVKGWTVVDPARRFLNRKKRDCMQGGCSFTGTYKQLRKHVKLVHPFAQTRCVDPVHEQSWRALETERERQDVISTIRSTMPRSIVFGDYVIDLGGNSSGNSNSSSDTDNDVAVPADIDRSVLYFFLREGSRMVRLEGEGDDVAAANLSGGVDRVRVRSGRRRRLQRVRRRTSIL